MEAGAGSVRVTLCTVSGRVVAKLAASTTAELLEAAAAEGYHRCRLVAGHANLPPDATLADCDVADGDVVTVIGTTTAPAPRQPPRPHRWARPPSYWGPAGPPTVGPLRGSGPAAPPGSTVERLRTLCPGTRAHADAVAARCARLARNPPSEAIAQVRRQLMNCVTEDAAREALRQADMDVNAASGLLLSGRLAVPLDLPTLVKRDIRDSQLLAARAVVRRRPRKLLNLMEELRTSHPQMYDCVIADQAHSQQLVKLLVSEHEQAAEAVTELKLYLPPDIPSPCEGVTTMRVEELGDLLRMVMKPLLRRNQARDKRLEWLRKASSPRDGSDSGDDGLSDDDGDDEAQTTPQTPS